MIVINSSLAIRQYISFLENISEVSWITSLNKLRQHQVAAGTEKGTNYLLSLSVIKIKY